MGACVYMHNIIIVEVQFSLLYYVIESSCGNQPLPSSLLCIFLSFSLPLSLSLFPQQLDVAEAESIEPSRLSSIYISLARTHIDCGQFPEALEYYNKELEHCCSKSIEVGCNASTMEPQYSESDDSVRQSTSLPVQVSSDVPYSRKYWWELRLSPKSYLRDLIWWFGTGSPYIHVCKLWWIFGGN